MIPAKTMARLATIGLTDEQAEAVAAMLAEVERATEEKAAAAIEARRASEAARTARYRERGGGNIPSDLRQAVFERDGFACVYCGSDEYLQCDHDIPVSKGGETTLENLATACRVCNAKKKDRDRKAFVRSLSKEIQGNIRTNQTSEDILRETPSPPSPKDNIKPLSTPTPTQTQREREAEFVSVFWPEYPHKVGKPVALKSYISARNRASAEKIMAGLRAYVSAKPAGRDWLNPATFLNQDRFDDAPAIVAGAQPASGPPRAPPRSDPQEIHNPALRALQRLSQKNAQRTDEPDIFSARSGPGQCAPSGGNPAPETGDAPGRFGPVLNLAAYR